MRWNEGNGCVPICLPQRMSEGSKERGCHCKSDKHLGRAGTRFHRTPGWWRSPHSHVPLAVSGSWRLGIPFSPGDPAVSGRCTPLRRDKGQVPVGFNVSLHRAPSSCCLGWHWCIWQPPYFFFAAGLEPHGASSKSSKKGFCPCWAGGRRCEMQRQLPGARKEVWNWSWAKWVRWGWCGVCNGVREGRAARQKQCGGFT